jgi:protein TonB
MPIRSSHGRGEDPPASADEGRSQEQERGVAVESSHAIPLLIPPVLKAPILPGYPADAIHVFLDSNAFAAGLRAEAGQGRTVLKILVQADGSVGHVDVVASAGMASLDDAAVRAAWGWQFEPATRDGQPIVAWALVPVRFVLR